MKGILLIIVVIAIAVAGYYYFAPEQSGEEGTNNEETSQMTENNTTQAPDESTVKGSIVGSWQSNEDSKSVREFKADGTVEERYDGEVISSSGVWSAFADASIDPNVPVIEGATYLKIEDGGEVYYYSVASISADQLALIYLDRGGALTYTRITTE